MPAQRRHARRLTLTRVSHASRPWTNQTRVVRVQCGCAVSVKIEQRGASCQLVTNDDNKYKRQVMSREDIHNHEYVQSAFVVSSGECCLHVGCFSRSQLTFDDLDFAHAFQPTLTIRLRISLGFEIRQIAKRRACESSLCLHSRVAEIVFVMEFSW